MDKYKVKLLPRASRDIEGIYRYIVDEFKEVSTAEQLIASLETAILGLDEMPYRGSVRRIGAFANRGYRQIFVKNFTIVYRIDKATETVIVVTVRYTPSSF